MRCCRTGTAVGENEDARHRAWRADYLTVSPEAFPATAKVAPLLYPSQDTQFQYGLRLLIDGLRLKVAPGR